MAENKDKLAEYGENAGKINLEWSKRDKDGFLTSLFGASSAALTVFGLVQEDSEVPEKEAQPHINNFLDLTVLGWGVASGKLKVVPA